MRLFYNNDAVPIQGIVGDPGLPGRDGDPGIEVLYSADNHILKVPYNKKLDFQSFFDYIAAPSAV